MIEGFDKGHDGLCFGSQLIGRQVDDTMQDENFRRAHGPVRRVLHLREPGEHGVEKFARLVGAESDTVDDQCVPAGRQAIDLLRVAAGKPLSGTDCEPRRHVTGFFR